MRLTAVFDAQHGGFETGWSPISWGSIDELFVNLTMPLVGPTGLIFAKWSTVAGKVPGAAASHCSDNPGGAYE